MPGSPPRRAMRAPPVRVLTLCPSPTLHGRSSNALTARRSANHGYINRNGRNIDLQMMQQGFLDAFGFAFDVTQPGGVNAINQQANGAGTFDLDTLNAPHAIEHDASLSRNDREMAWSQDWNNFAFNASVWEETLDWYGPVQHIDVVSANTARLGRIGQAKLDDWPGWFVENDGGSLAEHSFTLTSMNDPAVGTVENPSARLDWVSYWISNERLPTALGWAKQPGGISGAQQAAVAGAVAAAATTVPAPRSPPSTPTSVSSSSVGLAISSVTPVAPVAPTYKPMWSNGTTTATTTLAVKPTPITTVTPISAPTSIVSSASAKATQIAGPVPSPPNAYKDTLTPQMWKDYISVVTVYVETVEVIIRGFSGVWNLGSMPLPNLPGSPAPAGAPAPAGSSFVPWYASPALSPSSDQCVCK